MPFWIKTIAVFFPTLGRIISSTFIPGITLVETII